MKYYVIGNSDGEAFVDVLSKEELISRLNKNYYGDGVNFFDEIEDTDTNYWGNRIAIIKGELITPTPKEVVKSFEIE